MIMSGLALIIFAVCDLWFKHSSFYLFGLNVGFLRKMYEFVGTYFPFNVPELLEAHHKKYGRALHAINNKGHTTTRTTQPQHNHNATTRTTQPQHNHEDNTTTRTTQQQHNHEDNTTPVSGEQSWEEPETETHANDGLGLHATGSWRLGLGYS